MEKVLESVSSLPKSRPIDPVLGAAISEPNNEQILEEEIKEAPFELQPESVQELIKERQQEQLGADEEEKLDQLQQTHQEYIYTIKKGGRRRPNMFSSSSRPARFQDDQILSFQNQGVSQEEAKVIEQNQQLPVLNPNLPQEVPENLNISVVIPDDQDRNNPRTQEMWERFKLHMLTILGSQQIIGMSAKDMLRVFNEYREFLVDGRKKKELPLIRDQLKDLSDYEIEEWINNHEIHRQCKWKMFWDQNGQKHYQIVCDFNKKKEFYTIK